MVSLGGSSFHKPRERFQSAVDSRVDVFEELGADSRIGRVGLDHPEQCRGLDGESPDIVGKRNQSVKLVVGQSDPRKQWGDFAGKFSDVGIEQTVSLGLCNFFARCNIRTGVTIADSGYSQQIDPLRII